MTDDDDKALAEEIIAAVSPIGEMKSLVDSIWGAGEWPDAAVLALVHMSDINLDIDRRLIAHAIAAWPERMGEALIEELQAI